MIDFPLCAVPGDLGGLVVALVILFFSIMGPVFRAWLEAKAIKAQQEKAQQEQEANQFRRQHRPQPRPDRDHENVSEYAVAGDVSTEGRAQSTDTYEPPKRPRKPKRKVLRLEPEVAVEGEPARVVTARSAGLARLESSFPSESVFGVSERLASPVELSGLKADALPSDQYDPLYQDPLYQDATAATGSAPPPFPTRASELLRLFSSPQSMQQAMILSEIFRRPYGDER